MIEILGNAELERRVEAVAVNRMRIKNTLIRDNTFSLPGRKALLKSD